MACRRCGAKRLPHLYRRLFEFAWDRGIQTRPKVFGYACPRYEDVT